MSTTSTLVNLSRRLDQKLATSGVVNFARNQDDESTMSKVGKGAAIGAGLAGAAAGGLYLRGRAAAGRGAPNVGIPATIKGGADALKSDFLGAKKAAGKAMTQGAKVVGANANAAKTAVMNAGKIVGKRTTAAVSALRGK